MNDADKFHLRRAPAAERNIEPILDVLRAQLPASGRALEIASGTGQHAAAFAQNFPEITWCPSDASADARRNISAWGDHSSLGNLKAPLDLDVTREGWQKALDAPFDVILAINLIHISPWAATQGLMHGAGELLAHGGMLYLYGPYRRNGVHTAASNVKFDAWLKEQDQAFGVKDMDEVTQQGEKNGLKLAHVLDMPANNFSLIFQKT